MRGVERVHPNRRVCRVGGDGGTSWYQRAWRALPRLRREDPPPVAQRPDAGRDGLATTDCVCETPCTDQGAASWCKVGKECANQPGVHYSRVYGYWRYCNPRTDLLAGYDRLVRDAEQGAAFLNPAGQATLRQFVASAQQERSLVEIDLVRWTDNGARPVPSWLTARLYERLKVRQTQLGELIVLQRKYEQALRNVPANAFAFPTAALATLQQPPTPPFAPQPTPPYQAFSPVVNVSSTAPAVPADAELAQSEAALQQQRLALASAEAALRQRQAQIEQSRAALAAQQAQQHQIAAATLAAPAPNLAPAHAPAPAPAPAFTPSYAYAPAAPYDPYSSAPQQSDPYDPYVQSASSFY